MDDLLGHSITYRVAMGERAGQKVFTLHTVPAQSGEEPRKGVAEYAGFSLRAGTSVEPEQTGKLERLCGYVSRPVIAEQRLALTERGDVRLKLKTAYRDGTTQVILEPLDFLARLATLASLSRRLSVHRATATLRLPPRTMDFRGRAPRNGRAFLSPTAREAFHAPDFFAARHVAAGGSIQKAYYTPFVSPMPAGCSRRAGLRRPCARRASIRSRLCAPISDYG